ncbi:MAG: hypothetical protein HGA20_14315 [Geobacteraceae bacterium]|nr:hypothetical protein [Geobacteraceae bacterium]
MRFSPGALAVLLIMSLLLLMQPQNTDAAHPKPGESGYRGLTFPAALPGIPLFDYFTRSPIIPTGPAVNGFYKGLPPFSTKVSCNVCHYDIVANESRNRHSSMSYEKIALPQYGVGYDKSMPWISGPGKFGKWSPAYNRQLGNMNTTYTSEADLLKKLDMGAFEFITECGVCHVGGGPAVSNPYGFTFPWRISNVFGADRGAGGIHNNLDNVQRNQSIANDFIFPLLISSPYYPLRVPLNPWDYFVTDNSVKKVDWAQWGYNGTLDLDCLMCHQEGYNHLSRNEEIIRNKRLYNAATLGSGIAVIDPLAGEGFNMDYDASKVILGADGSLYLSFSVTDKMTRFPKGENCVHCHMPTVVKNEAGNVDWKKSFYSYDAIPSDNPAEPGNMKPARYLSDMVKRGDIWNNDEVHKFLECAGCHSQTGKFQAWKPADANYMHSPGKGYDPINPGSDEFGGTVKFCYDCHISLGDINGDNVPDMETFGAPLGDSAHSRAGLLTNIVTKARRINTQGVEEEFTGNHLDVISCTTCHIKKQYAAARSVDFSTGGQFYNFVGSPLDQTSGPESIDLAYSWKETTPVRLLPNGTPNPLWRRLIYPFNYVTGVYWNNIGSKDANADGFTTGMSNNGEIVVGDPFFQRSVKENFVISVNSENNRIPVGLLNSSVFDTQSIKNDEGAVVFTRPGEIEAYKNLVTSKDAGFVPQLVLESEPYLITHNVLAKSRFALGKLSTDINGATVYGCSDCHGATGGVYNGQINMIGKGKRPDNSPLPLTVSWNNPSDVLTKAFYWDKAGNKKSASFSDLAVSPKVTKFLNRGEFLGYDTTRVAELNNNISAAAYGLGVNPVANISSVFADMDTQTPGIQVYISVAQALAAADAQAGNVGSSTYTWTSNDGTAIAAGQTSSVTFTTVGLKSITLKVVDEEGKSSQITQNVYAVAAPAANQVTWADAAGSLGGVLTISALPTPNNSLRIYWGDGKVETVIINGLVTATRAHTYVTAGNKLVKVYVYSSAGAQLALFTKTITVDGAN